MLRGMKLFGVAIVAAALGVVITVPAGASPNTEGNFSRNASVPPTSAREQALPARDTGSGIGAAGALGCTYPYVCLYNANDQKVEQYRVVTSGWQSFSRTDVYYGVNTRNDDVAYIRYTNGTVACLPAGTASTVWNLRAHGVPNGIRIDSSSVCFP